MHSHVTWILYESMSHWSPQSYGQSALSFFIYQSHPSIQIHITFCCLLCFVVFYFLFVWMVLIMSGTWKPHWASRLRWVDYYSIPTTSYVNWQPLYMQHLVFWTLQWNFHLCTNESISWGILNNNFKSFQIPKILTVFRMTFTHRKHVAEWQFFVLLVKLIIMKLSLQLSLPLLKFEKIIAIKIQLYCSFLCHKIYEFSPSIDIC